MISKVFAVFDVKVGVYERPFFMRTRGEAVRSWVEVVNDPETKFNKHPEDFGLFEIAEYDDEKGVFQNLQAPQSIGLALEYVKKA